MSAPAIEERPRDSIRRLRRRRARRRGGSERKREIFLRTTRWKIDADELVPCFVLHFLRSTSRYSTMQIVSGIDCEIVSSESAAEKSTHDQRDHDECRQEQTENNSWDVESSRRVGRSILSCRGGCLSNVRLRKLRSHLEISRAESRQIVAPSPSSILPLLRDSTLGERERVGSRWRGKGERAERFHRIVVDPGESRRSYCS